MRRTFTIGSMVLLGLIGLNTAQAQFVQSDKVVGDFRESRAEYGTSVDIQGNVAVVGASREAIAAGAAYIYVEDENGDWNYTQTLTAPDALEMAEFGGGAKFSDDFLVIASGRADVEGIIRAGALYVYEETDGEWTYTTKLTASVLDGDAKLGMNPGCLDAEGDIIVGGAPGENGWIGATYIFKREADEWVEFQKIDSPNMTSGDAFGISIAIDGNYLAIGGNEVNGKGAVFMYKMGMSGSYELIQEITASNGQTNDYFGTYIDLHNDELVVGASGTDGEAGTVYIYQMDENEDFQEVQIINGPLTSDLSQFGFSVALNDNYLAISEPHAWGFDEGSISLYVRGNDNLWTFSESFAGDDTVGEDFFGWSMSMDENKIIVGAPWEDHDADGGDEVDRAGSAYIFEDGSYVGVDDLSKSLNVSIYPVPTHDLINIEMKENRLSEVVVMSASGVVLNQIKSNGVAIQQVDLSNMAKGVYLIKTVDTEGNQVIKKVMRL